jgi:hypothetical protein
LDIKECQFRINHQNVKKLASSLPLDEFSRFCKFLEAREMTRAKLLIKALEQFRPQKARPGCLLFLSLTLLCQMMSSLKLLQQGRH